MEASIHSINLHNSSLVNLSRFRMMLYGYNSGHVFKTIQNDMLPLIIVAAADLDPIGRSMLQTVGKVPVASIFDSATSLLSWASSSVISNVDIHSPKTLSQSTVKIFWRLQATIILELRRWHELAMLAVIVHPSCDNSTFKKCICTLNDDKWRLSEYNSHLSAFGDSISDNVCVLLGVHRCTAPTVEPLSPITPPHIHCRPVSDFIHDKFQHSSYAISFAKDSINFVDDTSRFTVSRPKSSSIPTLAQTSRRLYDLVLKSDTTNIVSGCGLFDTNHLFPPLSRPSDNIFGRTFGVEFEFQSEHFVRPSHLLSLLVALAFQTS
jgi:hypothetical protein